MKIKDDNLWGLHIILPNNLSFIRVHKPHTADKLIKSGTKPLIDRVNATKKITTGFETGKFGYFLRIITPIFSNEKEFLGVAEFSMNVNTLTKYIKDELGYESQFLIDNYQNKKFLNELDKTSNGLTIFQSTNKKLFQNSFTGDKYSNGYCTVDINIDKSSKLLVAFNVKKIIKQEKEFKFHMIILLGLTLSVMLIIWYFTVLFYIKSKQKQNEIQKTLKLMDDNILSLSTDLEGNLISSSHAFCLLSGYTKEELIGINYQFINDRNTTKELSFQIWRKILNDKTWQGELKNNKKNGSFYWVDVLISTKYDENNIKIGYTAIMHDITNKKIVEELSITDGLTSLYNRRYFDEIFPKQINAAKRNKEKLVFSMIDIDHFKLYNDKYGHQEGDNTLIKVASALQRLSNRSDDYIFRLGGEEFGMLFRVKDDKDAFFIANKSMQNIEALGIEHSENSASPFITVSIGLFIVEPGRLYKIRDIYQQADEALYTAKNSGRNRFVVSS